MPFAPTRNNRVAPRKRTLTSPIPTVKDGMVRRGRRPASVSGDVRVASRLAPAPPIPSDKTSPTRHEKKLVETRPRGVAVPQTRKIYGNGWTRVENVRRRSPAPTPKPALGTPMSAPSVKTGTVRPPRPTKPQMRLNATTIKVAKKPKRSR